MRNFREQVVPPSTAHGGCGIRPCGHLDVVAESDTIQAIVAHLGGPTTTARARRVARTDNMQDVYLVVAMPQQERKVRSISPSVAASRRGARAPPARAFFQRRRGRLGPVLLPETQQRVEHHHRQNHNRIIDIADGSGQHRCRRRCERMLKALLDALSEGRVAHPCHADALLEGLLPTAKPCANDSRPDGR